MSQVAAGNRLDRRRARTRAALVSAARTLMISRELAGVSIQEITDAADVGFGSFYNHFASKQDLFDAALAEVLDEHGAMLDEITADRQDPTEAFAASVRLTARAPKLRPDLAKIIDRVGPRYLTADAGLVPRALRELQRAKEAGRLTFDDPVVAIACVGGALLSVLHLGLLRRDPAAIDAAADELAIYLLRMFGLDDAEARVVVGRPLPRTRWDD